MGRARWRQGGWSKGRTGNGCLDGAGQAFQRRCHGVVEVVQQGQGPVKDGIAVDVAGLPLDLAHEPVVCNAKTRRAPLSVSVTTCKASVRAGAAGPVQSASESRPGIHVHTPETSTARQNER